MTCTVGFSFDLKCLHLEDDHWSVGAILICHVHSLNIIARGEIMDTNWYNGKISNDTRVNGVMIVHQIVNYMPKFSDLLAQRLEYLQVSNCHLKDISKQDLQQFPQLKYLRLPNNDLKRLDRDLFEFNPQLESVAFSGNENLKFVAENFLDSLTKLRFADFTCVRCVCFTASTPELLKNFNEMLKIHCRDESDSTSNSLTT